MIVPVFEREPNESIPPFPNLGSDQEIKYALMTHGFPVDTIPVNKEGEIDLSNHLKWVENRMILDGCGQVKRR